MINPEDLHVALRMVTRTSGHAYGHYALGGHEEVAKDIKTLYELAVAGMALCDSLAERIRQQL